MGRDWVHLSESLRNEIIGRVWEIFANAFEHSMSPVGVFTCGQYYPGLKTLDLTVVDFGKGIPSNVRAYLKQKQSPFDLRDLSTMTAVECLNWALVRGNTTSSAVMGRGLGLDLLRDFIKVNHGKMEILSETGYLFIGEQDRYLERNTKFSGTIVSITLRCDETFYKLASERSDVDIFS